MNAAINIRKVFPQRCLAVRQIRIDKAIGRAEPFKAQSSAKGLPDQGISIDDDHAHTFKGQQPTQGEPYLMERADHDGHLWYVARKGQSVGEIAWELDMDPQRVVYENSNIVGLTRSAYLLAGTPLLLGRGSSAFLNAKEAQKMLDDPLYGVSTEQLPTRIRRGTITKLPKGWHTQNVKHPSRTSTYFISPTGKRFRSLVAVERALQELKPKASAKKKKGVRTAPKKKKTKIKRAADGKAAKKRRKTG